MIYSLLANPKEPSTLATYFKMLNYKIYSYQQHNHATMALYRQELEGKRKKLAEQHQEDYTATEKRYDLIYNETLGDEETRRLVASHKSGIMDIGEAYEQLESDLVENFEEMCDYFNKSALIIFYALMESQLKRLCIILKEVISSRISVDDFSGQNYIKGSFKYLDLVIELPKAELDRFYTRIEHYQYVRNRIAHTEAEFELEGETQDEKSMSKINAILTGTDVPITSGENAALSPKAVSTVTTPAEDTTKQLKSEKSLEQIIAEADGLLDLVEDPLERKRYLRIYKHEYIDNAYHLLKELFDTLFILINKKLDFPILQERLDEMFIPYYPEHTVSIENVSQKGKATILKLKVLSKDTTDTKNNIYGTISLTPAKKDQFVPLNQLDGEAHTKMEEFLAGVRHREKRLYSLTFPDFVKPNPGLKVAMTFYPKPE